MLQKIFRQSSRRVRRFQAGILIGLGVGSIVAAAVWLGALNPYGARLSDLFYRARTSASPIVLIAIDDKTVREYDWPIERITQGAFLFTLVRAQPRGIVLDYFLPDPTNRYEDTFFAQFITRADKIVQPVLGIEATRYASLPNQFPVFDSILKPASVLVTPNTTLAHAMIYPDADGIVRRVPLLVDGPDHRYPSIALAAWALYQGRDPKIEPLANQIIFEGKPLPLDSQGQLFVNFINNNSITRVSYIDVAQGRIDPALLRDKIILVAPTSQVVHEAYQVPMTIGTTPWHNVEIQASLLDTLLTGNFLREQDLASRILMVIALGLFAGITLIHFHRRYAAALAIVILAAYALIVFWQFDQGVILAPLDVLLVLALTLPLTMAYRYVAEERTRAFIARIFLGSVAPEAVNEVLAQYDRGALSLSGGRREVSVLAVTLRGITPMSEASAPEAVIQVMNAYSARVFEIVFRLGGSVHSQVGNTIIAMWNLPLTYEDHGQRAVNAAFEIQQQLERLSPSTSERTAVEVGLGVATGTVVVGHLPVSQRAEYSVIGDVVNVAERLSVLATQNRVIVDTPTREKAGDAYEAEAAQAIRLRGKKDAVETWELSPRITIKQISMERSRKS